ncbi:hypothetical protein AO501_26055 [Mycobacterium gordonae]|uniref:Uncharacterized protein n=1 Tax=Mycobacterium gordonae TaxID=1778 RepID=A0A0Q2QLZ5_MYCGO|nr:hypothetical protein AO501_26055 [Mycobacterium gordonae]
MQETTSMRGVQGFGNLVDNVDRACGIERPLRQQGAQVASFNQPHIDVEAAIDLAIVVNWDDVRAI